MREHNDKFIVISLCFYEVQEYVFIWYAVGQGICLTFDLRSLEQAWQSRKRLYAL